MSNGLCVPLASLEGGDKLARNRLLDGFLIAVDDRDIYFEGKKNINCEKKKKTFENIAPASASEVKIWLPAASLGLMKRATPLF